jgi:integrase/recombinase XerD
LKNNGSSERCQNNNLNVMIDLAKYLDCDTTFYNINKKEMIISFLDTKIKKSEDDPDIRWIMLKKKIIAV